MFSIKSLMGMIATNAVETGGAREVNARTPEPYSSYRDDLPDIRHPLRLERDKEGRIYWRED